MNFKYTKALAAAAAILAAATSCSDNDWEPGPDVAPDCMTVYFEQLNSYNLILEPDDSRLVPVTVGRAKVDEAANITLTVTAPEGVVVPSSVSFAAGEQSKTIFIDLENMAPKSSGTVSITLPEEMTSPYGAGSSNLSLNVTVSGAWLPLATDVRTSYADDKFPAIENGTLYYLDGTNNFKFANFLNSGVDLIFTVNEPGTGTLKLVPIKNFMDVHDYWGADYSYDGWMLYDTDNATYPQWAPDGNFDHTINLAEFEDGYNTINFTDGMADFSPYFYFLSGEGSNFFTIYIDFTPSFNPFADPSEGEGE